MDNSFTEITIPDIRTNDNSYGYNNAPIGDQQVSVGNNRNISGLQYFAFDVQAISGTGGTNIYTDIIFTGNNGDLGKSYTQLFYKGLGGGNEITGNFTKKYTTDTYFEDNVSATQVNGIIRIKSGGIAEINTRFNTSTMFLRLAVIAGSHRFLLGSSLEMTTANPSVTIINSSNRDLQLKMQYATTASERPIFGIFIKIY